MKNSIITICLIIFALSNINAQESSSKLYKSLGYFFSTGAFPLNEIGPNSNGNFGVRQELLFDAGYSYGLKFNVVDVSDNMSISLNARPALGIGWSEIGWLSARLPVSAALNLGAGSTYDTDSDYGVGLDFGVEYVYTPLIKSGENEFYERISNYSPFAQISFRYWKTSKNRLHEIFVRGNYLGSNDEDLLTKYPNEDPITPFLFSVGFNKFLDY